MITVNQWKNDYIKELGIASSDYLSIAFQQYVDLIKADHKRIPDAILGNATISLELALKAFIASRSLTLIFEKLPDNLNVALQAKDNTRFHSEWSSILNGNNIKTISFERCISLVSLLLNEKPSERSRFLKLTKGVNNIRNNSIHSILFRKNHVLVVGVLSNILSAISIFAPKLPQRNHLMKVCKSLSKEEFIVTLKDTAFKRVQAKLQDTTSELPVKNITPTVLYPHEQIISSCPKCKRSCLLEGFVAEYYLDDVIGDIDDDLFMYPYSLDCPNCGLKLDGFEELVMAKIDEKVPLNITNEEFEEFNKDRVLYNEISRVYKTKDKKIIDEISINIIRQERETGESRYTILSDIDDNLLDIMSCRDGLTDSHLLEEIDE